MPVNHILRNAIWISALMLVTTTAMAQSDPDWVQIAGSQTRLWHVKVGSYEHTATHAGLPINVVVGRISDTATGHIDLYKWYVSDADCDSHMGKVVSLHIDGTYGFDNDFVFGAGSVATSMAQNICAVRNLILEKNKDKGL